MSISSSSISGEYIPIRIFHDVRVWATLEGLGSPAHQFVQQVGAITGVNGRAKLGAILETLTGVGARNWHQFLGSRDYRNSGEGRGIERASRSLVLLRLDTCGAVLVRANSEAGRNLRPLLEELPTIYQPASSGCGNRSLAGALEFANGRGTLHLVGFDNSARFLKIEGNSTIGNLTTSFKANDIRKMGILAPLGSGPIKELSAQREV